MLSTSEIAEQLDEIEQTMQDTKDTFMNFIKFASSLDDKNLKKLANAFLTKRSTAFVDRLSKVDTKEDLPNLYDIAVDQFVYNRVGVLSTLKELFNARGLSTKQIDKFLY